MMCMRQLVEILEKSLSTPAIMQWFITNNLCLDGKLPVEVWSQGEYDKVLAVAKRSVHESQ